MRQSIEITAVLSGLCDLEVKQVEKEVFRVKVEGKEQSFCWTCLRKIVLMQTRNGNGQK